MLKSALRTLAIVAAALTLSGCGGWVPDLAKAYGTASTTEVPVTKADAQKALAALQIGHAAVVRTQTAYLKQTPCGAADAKAPPFCASYRVGVQMKAYDDAFSKSMAAAQNDVDTLGDNPTVLATAVKAAQLAFATFKSFTDANAPK